MAVKISLHRRCHSCSGAGFSGTVLPFCTATWAAARQASIAGQSAAFPVSLELQPQLVLAGAARVSRRAAMQFRPRAGHAVAIALLFGANHSGEDLFVKARPCIAPIGP